jgi:hypothetical protein
MITANVRSPSHANPTTLGEGGAGSSEANISPDSIPSTAHGYKAAGISPDERIPTNATGSPSIDHENTRRGNSPEDASARHGAHPRGVEHEGYQTHAGIFNNARSPTINGGVFFYVQGNVSYRADDMPAPQ